MSEKIEGRGELVSPTLVLPPTIDKHAALRYRTESRTNQTWRFSRCLR